MGACRAGSDSVIGRALLVRAWAVLGLVSAARVMAGSLCARQRSSYA